MTQALRATLYRRIGVAVACGPKLPIGIAIESITFSIVIAEAEPRHTIVKICHNFVLFWLVIAILAGIRISILAGHSPTDAFGEGTLRLGIGGGRCARSGSLRRFDRHSVREGQFAPAS